MSTGVARGGVLLALVAAALAQNCDPQMDPDCAYETHTGGGSTTGGDGDCVDDPDCSGAEGMPKGCQSDADCADGVDGMPAYCEANGICDAHDHCVGECMVRRPPCHKDKDCPLNQICNDVHACIIGDQGCDETKGDVGCQREPTAALDPVAVAASLNERFNSDTNGVLIHFLDDATEQQTKWQLCTDTTDPGCDGEAAQGAGAEGSLQDILHQHADPDSAPVSTRHTTCGRSAFSVLNKFAWNPATGVIDTWRRQDPASAHDDVQPPTPGFIGADGAMLGAVSCIFPGEAGSGQRGSNGCGRSFYGYGNEDQAPTARDCAANCPSSATADAAACAASRGGGGDEYWCTSAAQNDGCAMRPAQLADMMTEFGSRGVQAGPGAPGHWTEAVVDAQTWNDALPGSVSAFVADTRCMQSHTCFQTLREMWCGFRVEFGIELPVLGLDSKEQTNPFVPISEFRPKKVDCPADVCEYNTPQAPPTPVGDSVFSCDFGEHPVTTDNGQHFTEPDACDDLDDLTAMILPLNAECCDEPEEDCTLGYPLTCNEGCAAVLLPFKRACDPLFNSDAAGIELRQIGGIINRAAASCPADGGYFGECGDAHAVTCVDGSCAGSQAECDALAAPCPGQEVCPDGVTCIPEYADGGFQCPGGH